MERVWMKIGEAAARLGVKPKELRYWEHIIPEIQARRSKGNLRYYHVDELERLAQIRNWLQEGFTVADCRELLLTGQVTRGLDLGEGFQTTTPVLSQTPKAKVQGPRRPDLAKVVAALGKLLTQLKGPVKP